MDKPNRTQTHILSRKSSRYLENIIPDEWHFNIPHNDYGLDYHVEISLNQQVTGLNFSIQLKSTAKTTPGDFAKISLKRATLNYYKVRLEPVMLVFYDEEVNEAYWSWIFDLDVDLSKTNSTFNLKIPKSKKLSEIKWEEITNDVQRIFNAKSFISDFDIVNIVNNIELGAWKTYYEGDYEQAAYLFGRLVTEGFKDESIYQALSWSFYQSYRYNEALNTIDILLQRQETENSLKIKACILAESGFRDQDKGKIIQAKNIFKKFSTGEDSAIMLFNYGNALNALSSYYDAIEQYKLSLIKDPNHAQCWKNMGTTYYNIGEHEIEISCYDKALSIDPDLPQALFSKGITLAQHYHKYEEALQLFHLVLDKKNNLTHEYVNGLFWVAYCYEQINDFTKALFWIDKGLNHEGSNPYFLNFKSNLLGRNWAEYPELKEKAIEFFEYRIELENDSRSLYHLIIIKENSLESALEFLKTKLDLYKKVSILDLDSISFSLEDLLATLLHLDFYNNFRTLYPNTRYLDHLISPHFSISANFFNLLDLIFGLAFNKAILRYGESHDEMSIPKSLLETMLIFMPKLVSFLIPHEEYNELEVAEILTVTFQGYIDMIYREIGAQSGHITGNIGLRTIDPSEFITADYNDQLGERTYNIFIECLTEPNS